MGLLSGFPLAANSPTQIGAIFLFMHELKATNKTFTRIPAHIAMKQFPSLKISAFSTRTLFELRREFRAVFQLPSKSSHPD